MAFYDSYPKFENFDWKEIVDIPISKQGITSEQIPLALRANIIPTMKVLQELRNYYGKPIIINSTYRTHKYNKEIGGKENSLHLSFNAVDFTVKDKDDLRGLYLTLDMWDKTSYKLNYLPKEKGNLGLGLYPTFIHLDTRSTLGRAAPARWRG